MSVSPPPDPPEPSEESPAQDEKVSSSDAPSSPPASEPEGLSDDSPFEQKLAQNPELRRYAEDAVSFHEEALSENTREAYEAGWRDFCLFCNRYEFTPLPADAGTVALYLSFLAKKKDSDTGTIEKEGLVVPTLEQRLSAIRFVHEEQGHESPTSTRQVKNVMAGIRRNQKHRHSQANPLLTYHVKRLVDALPKIARNYEQRKRTRAKTASGAELTAGERRYLKLLQIRNRALLLLGYAGALRRSEIASLTFAHIRREPGHGLVLDIRSSKTDPEGKGYLIYIPRLESEYDPVRALDHWKKEAALEKGPVFRGITRGGNVQDRGLTGRTVNNVVKQAVELADLSDPDGYSAHSLRAGHATQATKNGVPAEIAMNTTRHQSREQFQDYVRNEEEAFESASSGKLGL